MRNESIKTDARLTWLKNKYVVLTDRLLKFELESGQSVILLRVK
jgi:hypothetical protein